MKQSRSHAFFSFFLKKRSLSNTFLSICFKVLELGDKITYFQLRITAVLEIQV